MVSSGGSRVVDGDQREGGEEEEQAEEGGVGGGEVATTPLDDLNIHWTISTSGFSEEVVGTNGSDGVDGSGSGERVVVTHPVEPSVQPVTTKEGRDVVVPTKEGAASGKEREGPRGDGSSGSGDDPKGKRVATEEPVTEQGPMGISLGDYAVHADPEDVVAIGREASRVLNAVREEVIKQREAEMATLHRA